MVYKIKGKRGQAAIEFLMTYGWMLLVVLIVGALIFSFVDFGSLLPNKVDISSPNMLPVVADSYAQGNTATGGAVLFAFKYNGVRPIEFTVDSTVGSGFEDSYDLSYNFGDTTCSNVAKIYNNDIDETAKDLNIAAWHPTETYTATDTNIVRFRTGHSGYVLFEECSDFNQFDVFEGDMKITYTSTQTGSSTPVFGNIRFTKQ